MMGNDYNTEIIVIVIMRLDQWYGQMILLWITYGNSSVKTNNQLNKSSVLHCS